MSFDLTRPMGTLGLVPMEKYDVMPRYYIFGGMIFMPLSKNLLRRWGRGWYSRAPKHLVSLLYYNIPEQEGDEIVVMTKVLPADLNQGYHSFAHWVVDSVNGKKIRNLKHLVQILERDKDQEYVVVRSRRSEQLVVNTARAWQEQEQILKTYRIPFDRSVDLR